MSYQNETEDRLMERVHADDRHAFDEIVLRYQHRLQSYAARMLTCDPAAAADVAVEAFVRLWQHRLQFRRVDKLAAWLLRTTHRLVLDELSRTRSTSTLEADAADPDDLTRLTELRSRAEAVRVAVSGLSLPLRTVFILSVYEEMTYDQIATTLEISPGTVASRKHEALEKLRGKLTAWQETHGNVAPANDSPQKEST